MDEGLSTRMEQSRKMQEPDYYDRNYPSYYGLLQDDWKRNGWIWFSDVLLEAGMITAGSMTGVMNGKNVVEFLNSHKTLTKAII